MRKVCFKALVFFLMVHLNSCADISPRELPIEGVWTIEAQESFLNGYDICYLGEQIEFLDNKYYIFKTNCNSEKPYGLIKIGYYEIRKDSILFFNERHSLQVNGIITTSKEEKLKLVYKNHILNSMEEIVSQERNLILKR